MLLRESTEGLFHSHGAGDARGDEEAYETLRITRAVSERLFDFAFDLAAERRAQGGGRAASHAWTRPTCFQALAFFRRIFHERAARRPDLTAEAAYVDAMALRMVQAPWDLDVLVTKNMFGDILSDLGAGLMGGLGHAPSADIGRDHAVFRPCHGSAPDITGRGWANPAAMILSGAMMLDWLGRRHDAPALAPAGERLRAAVGEAIAGREAPPRSGPAAPMPVPEPLRVVLVGAGWFAREHVTVRRGAPLETAAADYLRTMEAVEAAYRSHRKGRRIALPLAGGPA